MRKTTRYLFIIVTLFILTSCRANDEKTYQEQAQSYLEDYKIPGMAMIVIEDGETSFIETLSSNTDKEYDTFETDSIFRTESISKTITSFMVLRLIEQNILDLEDEVDTYLTNLDIPRGLTIKHLLTHTSGLDIGAIGVHYHPESDYPSAKENIASTLDFRFPINETFFYSNVGYNFLELVIEEATNKDFEENFQELIGRPLNLSVSSFTYKEEYKDKYIGGYDLKGNYIPPYVYPDKASGGFLTNLQDMEKLLHLFLSPTILLDSTSNYLQTPLQEVTGEYSLVSEGYSLGHFIDGDVRFHGGQGHGWMAFFMVHDNGEDGLFMVTNSQRSYPMFSGMIALWEEKNEFENIGFSTLSKLLPYLKGIGIIVVGVFIALCVRYIRSLKERRWLTVRKLKCFSYLEFLILLILTGFILYLELANYVFLRVLYPNIMDRMMIVLIFYDILLVFYFLKPKTKENVYVRD